MWHVYVLRSGQDGNYYVGMTNTPLQERLERHNLGRVKSTKSRRPFELVYSEHHADSLQARAREKFFKGGVGRKFLHEMSVGRRNPPEAGKLAAR